MARKKLEQETITLEKLIPQYGEKNTECNALKKVVADLNSKLKSFIKENKQQNKDIVVHGWKCSLTITEDVTTNEDRLLEVLKANNVPAIKTREYVDAEELERLIYAGIVPKNVLLEIDSCNTKTQKETLRCSKVKEV